MKNFTVIFVFLLAFGVSCAEEKSELTNFLVGTWKVKDKEQYEVWEQTGAKELKGYAYRMQQGEQQITETLKIRKLNGQWVYEATVPDQNDGATIRFTLNAENPGIFSFENLQHDFPKKIQYKKLSENELEVKVLGAEGSGFFFIQERY